MLYGNFGIVDYRILGGDLGGDLMRISLGWLRLWVTVLMILARTELFRSGEKKFCLVVVGMVWLLIIVFLSLDLFVFYFAFERVLVPTLILIVGWGYQPERLQAGIYLIFYTVFASLPLLVVIL